MHIPFEPDIGHTGVLVRPCFSVSRPKYIPHVGPTLALVHGQILRAPWRRCYILTLLRGKLEAAMIEFRLPM